jgi:hypothetical protein
MALRSNCGAGQIKGARGILLDWKVELGCPCFDLAMAAMVTRVARFGSMRNWSGQLLYRDFLPTTRAGRRLDLYAHSVLIRRRFP